MDQENKHNFAKKTAIAIGAGAAVAGANAINKVWPIMEDDYEKDLQSVPNSETDVDEHESESIDNMDYYEGDYSIITEDEVPAEVEATEITAESVNLDDLSFGEAFRQARQLCGSGGGVFEWHGNLYNTYTREEYENLDEEDMDRLYEAYKQAANGDTDVLISSLERTITNDIEEITCVEVENISSDDVTVLSGSDEEINIENEDIYGIEQQDNDIPADVYDPSLSSDNIDIDFTNLYS